jgi:GDP-L-fucose synthase
MKRSARILVAGSDTLIQAALRERLHHSGFEHVLTPPAEEPDLTDVRQVEDFFSETLPEFVFLTGGQRGGIQANRTRPAELMHHNLLVAANVIHAAHNFSVKKLLYLASSCGYPKDAPQPMQPQSLMTGPLEETSAAYATAKLAGIYMGQAYGRQYGDHFITAIPTNSFGPHDDFSLADGHVVAAWIRRFHEAKSRGEGEVILWGTGTPRREFIYAPDLADACLLVMTHYDKLEPINLGSGMELSIAELAREIAQVVGYRGRLRFDANQPDGMVRKLLDSSALHSLGWRPKTEFRTALEETYTWFQFNGIKEERDASAIV